MGRSFNIFNTDFTTVEAFNEVQMALNAETIAVAQLMAEERRLRVRAFSEQLGSLLGMNPALDGWLEVTSTDPAFVLN